jgi:CRP/FNR family cyclic AMP-dependent transcriptional regulator
MRATLAEAGAHRATTRTARRRPLARVFDEDPDLLAGMREAEARAARLAGVAPAVTLARGPWHAPDEPRLFADHLGLLVLSGLLTRTVTIEGMESPELVGVGDVLRPWDDHEGEIASVPFTTRWTVLSDARIAVLDARFCRAICQFPSVVSALVSRSVQRTRWMSIDMALAHVHRVDARLLLLLWHLADRWGRVRRDGVEVPIHLTHSQLAKLIGAQRPSVTVALRDLATNGHLARQPDGGWLLTAMPPELPELMTRRATPHRNLARADG